MARGRAVNGNGTIRQRKDGRWEGIYTLGNDLGTGKLIKKSVYGATAEEVAKKIREITASIDSNTYLEPNKMPLKKWLDEWLNEYCADVKERTRNTYKSAIDTRIAPKLGAVRLCDLTTYHIQRFINDLGKGEKPLSPKTIKNTHGVLHSALEKAKLLHCIRENPADACTLPRVEKPDIRYMAGDDLKRFLKAIRGHQFESMFLVALFTGMRQGELLGLCWDAVDLDNGIITIKRQLQLIDGSYHMTTTKSGKARKLTPSSFVMDTLREQKKHQLLQRVAAGAAWYNPDGFVFTDAIGQHIARNTLYHNYKRVLEEAGLDKNLRFHDLRHSYAVFSMESGDNFKEIQEAMGHYSTSFTMDTYEHVSPHARKASSDRQNTAILNLLRNENEVDSDSIRNA